MNNSSYEETDLRKGYNFGLRQGYNKGYDDGYEDAKRELTAEEVADAISRKEAIQALENLGIAIETEGIDTIRQLPSVIPKPVNCEDCIAIQELRNLGIEVEVETQESEDKA